MLQLLQHLAAQGMGDTGGMHGAFPPNLPPQLASLMQVCLQALSPLSRLTRRNTWQTSAFTVLAHVVVNFCQIRLDA